MADATFIDRHVDRCCLQLILEAGIVLYAYRLTRLTAHSEVDHDHSCIHIATALAYWDLPLAPQS